MMASSQHQILVFETFCPKCHKVRGVNMDENIAGKKDLDSVQCICGRTLPIEALKYLFRKNGTIIEQTKYYIS